MKASLFRGKAGQAFVGGLITVFIGIVMLMTLLPTIQNYTEMSAGNLSEAGEDAGTTTVIRLIPLFIVLAFIAGIFVIIRFSG